MPHTEQGQQQWRQTVEWLNSPPHARQAATDPFVRRPAPAAAARMTPAQQAQAFDALQSQMGVRP